MSFPSSNGRFIFNKAIIYEVLPENMMNACTISNLHVLIVKGGSLIEASDTCHSFDPSPLQNSRSSFV